MTIALDHTAFDTGVSDVRTASLDLDERRRRLDRDVTGLLDGAWTGAAATAFGEAWAEWCEGADEAIAALAGMAELLDAAHGGLVRQDDASVDRTTRLAARLGGLG